MSRKRKIEKDEQPSDQWVLQSQQNTSLLRTEAGYRNTSPARANYLTVSEPRPLLRGALMGWLHHNCLWYMLGAAYLLFSLWTCGMDLQPLVPRAMVIVVTCWGVWLSDWLHNLDLKLGAAATAAIEFWYWKMDMVSIAAILTVQYLLWASNIFWTVPPVEVALVGLAPGIVAALMHSLVCFPAQHSFFVSCVKGIYVVQFLVLWRLGFVYATQSSCGFPAFLILPPYSIAFLCYAIRAFLGDFEKFGPHEVFHVFIILGHVATLTADIVFLERCRSVCSP